MLAHAKASPFVIEAKKKLIEHKIKSDGNKLTVTEVMRLKKKLLDPNRKTRLKIIAKKFGVSEMTLHRIKTGENWGHIQV
jgi:predicted DNA binding protein